jgi:hypothetical protein
MGLGFGLEKDTFNAKRKFRWLLTIPGISADTGSAKALPPRRGARPSLSWKEYECQHLTETIWYPFKPDWKPITLILYDIGCSGNVVFDWIKTADGGGEGIYDPENGIWTPVVQADLKRDAELEMFDGCGNSMEKWTLENCYPSSIEWGELDMESSDLVCVEVQLRYDRAYITSD